ncbi:MAG: histidine kinase N-terminal 7TM domain-containing protein [Chloroflexota bacterium]
MDWPYHYTPYVLPMLASAGFTAALLIYVWRRRSVPGARSLALAMLFTIPWAVGAALELAAVDVPTQIFWVKFQAVWMLPAGTAVFCFVLEYANLAHWLTRRTLILLAIPPLLGLLLIVTNEAHHWLWLDFPFEGQVHPVHGAVMWILLGYSYLLAAVQGIALLWLFVRSPQHRWPVGLILSSRLLVLIAFRLDVADQNPLAPLDLTILALTITSAMYALALFRFHMLDLIPVARETVIEQMQEGMLVLNAQQRIVDLNPAAEKILGVPAAAARGQHVPEILPTCPDLRARLDDPGATQSEISLGTGPTARHFALHLSPLKDRRGLLIGCLILLHDVTAPRRAQAQLLEQQRVVATLQERERLARELHDSAGQVLGYVSMQAQAIRKWVHDGETAVAEHQLSRLADAAQAAHADIRHSILSLKAGSAQEWSFLAALQQHLDAFRDHYGLGVELMIPPGLELAQAFEPGAGVQLLRIIQEAMTNARKHGRARCVQVAFERQAGQAQIIVADDGRGFDPDQLAAGAGDHFGLAFMRERLAQIGGRLTIHSRPGAGTQVMLQVPMVGREQGAGSSKQ